jgi:hypothetical protein
MIMEDITDTVYLICGREWYGSHQIIKGVGAVEIGQSLEA